MKQHRFNKGINQKYKTKAKVTSHRPGITVLELLIAMGIASLISLTMVMLYSSSLFQYAHSSGRIELTRRAREGLNRIATILTTAVKPNKIAEAIYAPPLPAPPWDTDPFNAPDQYNAVMFASPYDLLNPEAPPPNPRNPTYHLYEIALVPGFQGGNDIVLRRLLNPTTIDTSVEPRYLVRNIDNLDIKRIDNTALLIRIDISEARISDDYVKNTTQSRTPLRVSLNTLVQIPYYTK